MMLLLLFVLGLCVGSFLNVLVERLPRNESVLFGRSHCDHCKHKLLWYELIPLVSFFIQKGKSRCCHKRLSCQYPLVELITGIGFVLLFRLLPSALNLHSINFFSIVLLTSYFVLLSSFIVIFVTDFKYEIIPMEMIITGIIGIFVYQGMQFFVLHTSCFVLRDYFVGILFPAILAFLFFWL
ncbi:prepilin peptidase, partial [Patescibacteria group bacterium]|nr:prepilin peptidase [Patescibacteria group bacterium]